MHIGILEAGRPPEALAQKHGYYPAMFEAILRPHISADAVFKTYAVIDDAFPASVTEQDAWLITGSAFGVYDDAPWIPRLVAFLQDAAKAECTLIGICFGHQILAQALGGVARKYEGGWGVGAHTYTLQSTPEWMPDTTPDLFDSYVSHQDQVTTLPEGASLLASSVFCQNAMYQIGDRVLAMQSHPEMPSAYVRDLYDFRRERIGDAKIDAALESVAEGALAPDADRVSSWIAAFLHHSLTKRATQ